MANTSLKKNVFFNVIRSVVALLFPLITFPYASRILLPSGIGKVNFVNNIISYFTLIANLGISTYAIREAAKRRENKDDLSCFFKEIFVLHIVSTLIAYLLFLIAFFFVPKLQSYQTLLLLASVTIIFSTFEIDWLYIAEENFAYITLRSIIFQGLSLIFLFLLVKTKEDILWYLFLSVFCSVGTNIVNFIHSYTHIAFRKKHILHPLQHVKPLIIFFAMVLITSVYMLLDNSMLGFLSSDEQVGFYSSATKLNKMVVTLITAVTGVILPRLSIYSEKGKNDEVIRLFNKGLSYVCFISIPCAVGLSLLSRPLTLFFSGTHYIPAIFTMQLMTPIIFFISISGFIGVQFFTPLKKERWTLISVAIGAVINFSLNIIFIPRYGAFGAGIASVFAESAVTMVQIIIARKCIHKKQQCMVIFKCLISCTIMGLGVLFCLKYIQNIVLQIVLSILAGTFLYGFSSVLFQNKPAKELLTIIKKV